MASKTDSHRGVAGRTMLFFFMGGGAWTHWRSRGAWTSSRSSPGGAGHPANLDTIPIFSTPYLYRMNEQPSECQPDSRFLTGISTAESDRPGHDETVTDRKGF